MQSVAELPVNTTTFTPQSSAIARQKSLDVRRQNPRKQSKAQALDLQHALHSAGQSLGRDIRDCEDREERARVACALASVAKGWQSMTDQLRILSGKAAPGTLSPAERRAKAESKRPASRQSAPRVAVRPAMSQPDALSPAVDTTTKESLS